MGRVDLMGLACVLTNVANVASEPGPFPCPGAWRQGLRGWFVIVVCGVGPLARWSTGPRQPVSSLARQPVSPLAGFCPVSALICPVFGENPANAGAGGRRGGRCWSQLGAAGHLAGVWQAQVRARGCFMMGVRASTLPNSPRSPDFPFRRHAKSPRPGSRHPLEPSPETS